MNQNHRLLLLMYALCLGACLSGCTKTEMRFHFAAIEAKLPDSTSKAGGEPSGQTSVKAKLKFYRVTIKGESGNSLSKLQTGYYDATSLHQLFGQVSDNDSKNQARDSDERFEQVVVQIDPVTGRHKIVQRDQRFAIMFGTNADAVAQQISAFGSADHAGEQIGSLIAGAVGREDFEALYSSRTDAEGKRKAAEQLVAELEKMAEAIGTLSTTDADAAAFMTKLKAQLIGAMSEGLSAAGSGVSLPADFNEAITKAQGAKEAMVTK